MVTELGVVEGEREIFPVELVAVQELRTKCQINDRTSRAISVDRPTLRPPSYSGNGVSSSVDGMNLPHRPTLDADATLFDTGKSVGRRRFYMHDMRPGRPARSSRWPLVNRLRTTVYPPQTDWPRGRWSVTRTHAEPVQRPGCSTAVAWRATNDVMRYALRGCKVAGGSDVVVEP